MRPGPRFIHCLLILCAVALLAPVLPQIVWLLLAGLLSLAGAAVLEGILLRNVVFHVDRAPAFALSLDEEESVPFSVRTNSVRALSLTVRQMWPRLLETPSSTLSGRCLPGEVLRLSCTVHAVARGTEVLEAPHVAATFWGLSERIVQAGEPGSLSVVPNLRAVKRLHGRLNQFALQGLGARTAPRLGKGREFDRLREYSIDDDFRDIAWKASARNQKLIVREFRIDRSQDILLCVDRGHRMAARAGCITRVDHAVNASVLLAYLCNRMEDRVGMLSFGAEVERGIAQGRGASHLRQVVAFGTGIKAEFIHTDYLNLAAHLRRRARHRTLIAILTDLPEGDARFALIKAVKLLAPQHLPLVVVLSDPALKAASNFLPDTQDELCRTLVAKDVYHERQQTMRELRSRGALVVETAPQETGVAAINAYMDVKRRQML